MKQYTNVYGTLNVWDVINDLQAIGLQVKAVTETTITVAAANGYSISDIDQIMANRGFI